MINDIISVGLVTKFFRLKLLLTQRLFIAICNRHPKRTLCIVEWVYSYRCFTYRST